MSAESLIHIVKQLVLKYKDNAIIFNKMTQYIEQLPELLENTHTTFIEREKRKNNLESESESFVQKFLHTYKYYYHTSSELFFEYRTDNKYYLVKEDDVQHTILSTISTNKTLTAWKHKLKISILKRIKERDIFSCIPESETIQNVINKLYPSVCDNREKAKYFLTVLGDIILKKCSHTYFITNKAKPFLKEISNLACLLFGSSNLFNIFKIKYYDHKYPDCRILDTQECINLDNWTSYFKHEYALDLFCVAAHYSQRYESADIFLLDHCKDDLLKNHAFYLKDKNESHIIDLFYQKSTEPSEDCSISWKNMQFLWKHFIDTERLPNMFFSSTLKTRLIEQFKYDGHKDVFLDCTSKLLPNVSKFIHFWNENIELTDFTDHPSNGGHVTEELETEELETDELCSLFSYHTKINISEKNVLDLIKHYYPDIAIEDDKYILNVKCKIWDKKQEIIDSVKKYNNGDLIIDVHSDEVPMNELYQYYCKQKNRFTASKRYFEKFLKAESQLYITDDNFVKVDSFNNI